MRDRMPLADAVLSKFVFLQQKSSMYLTQRVELRVGLNGGGFLTPFAKFRQGGGLLSCPCGHISL